MDLEKKTSLNALQFASLSSSVESNVTGGIKKQLYVIKHDGSREAFDVNRIYKVIAWASQGHEDGVNPDTIMQETIRNVYDGINTSEISEALILAATAFIEKDPAYGYVAAQLLLKKLFIEVTGVPMDYANNEQAYRQSFIKSIKQGVERNVFDKRLAEFDLEHLAQELCLENDRLFYYMGLRTLYERYLIAQKNKRTELPQVFWMRVAMGLSIEEKNKTECAISFYRLISSLSYVPSTPTLLHAGLKRAQLSSCFLTTVSDDLHHIFKCIGDNAQMAKWSGGVANDWTPVRATGALIESINIESQGVIPFLKVANDTTASINRSGRRRGASVVYLETWHYDIEDFLDLRRNTGDDRRRTHDINTANWVPDLFMKRVQEDGQWTLFSPEEVPDLHDLYGSAFEQRYVAYEKMAEKGKIRLAKTIPAKQLWRKMLSRLFETGHPWITFKDSFNVRSPQDHAGVIHSTNLCTEISLNTSADETAVCNLGSINLSQHVVDGVLDKEKLAKTVKTAIHMLDNVIDINFYPIKEGQTSNLRHRPIGLGIMGFQDALFKMDFAFDDERALTFADETMEFISYHAILASSGLAAERGAYSSFKGSKWDRGLLPYDTVSLLEKERNVAIEVNRDSKLDWTPVRESIKKHGMRNSNTMAIAPTATISNIANCYPCIEPMYKNLYVKSNMSGEFTVLNQYLVQDLKKTNLWNEHMLDQLKYYDGNVQLVPDIPQQIKDKYKEAFEIDPEWLIELTAVRGKWIDQSQSHNVFMRGVSGKKLNDIYLKAWRCGLKATYYLRTLGATQIEKSTLDAKKFGFTQKRDHSENGKQEESVEVKVTSVEQALPQEDIALNNGQSDKDVMCSILNGPECDSCQ
ncbi:MAG: ribonucleoside-diphosphate reductase subunit alpha [Candidatus Dependentiae bacterium]